MCKIEIHDGEVQLRWASLEMSDSEIERLREMLAPAELQRASRFRVPRAARRFIAARAALRTVLASVTQLDPADVDFRFGKHGKPQLANAGPHFNASDTGDFVVVALATEEVGVDIELLRPLSRPERLAQRICADPELEELARTPEENRDKLLLRLWTCKEAALKAVGTGLPGGARNIEVEFPATGQPRLASLLGENDGWTLLMPDLHPTLVCSTVVRGVGWRAVSRPFSLHSR